MVTNCLIHNPPFESSAYAPNTYGCIQFNHDLSMGEVPGTLLGLVGWTKNFSTIGFQTKDQEFLYNWFSNQF